MNRRNLFRGIVGVGAGLVLPASLAENAETARRWWALGGVPDDSGWRDDCLAWREEARRAALRKYLNVESLEESLALYWATNERLLMRPAGLKVADDGSWAISFADDALRA